MPDPALLNVLADGTWHSGEGLGRRLGKTRAAIWKAVGRLRHLGLPIEAAPGLGYRWQGAAEMLSHDAILARLSPAVRSRLQLLEVMLICDSTNARLLNAPDPSPGPMQACLAEYQTQGRGRRGRRWLSPPCSGLCLSVARLFTEVPPGFTGLGLAVGVIVREVLAAAGAGAVRLKWPNDLVMAEGKLAGILVDVSGEAPGPMKIVVGIGLNISLPAAVRELLDEQAGAWAAADLVTLLPDAPRRRNELAAALIEALCHGLDEFATGGFAPFAARWRAADALLGLPVVVSAPAETLHGVARGIDDDGALLLDSGDILRRLWSGDVSLRRLA